MMNLLSIEQTLAQDERVYVVCSPTFSDTLNRLSLSSVILEYDYLVPSLWDALTPSEQSIATGFPERRKKKFIASRISLKLLACKMGLVDRKRKANTLETLNPHDGRPELPGAEGKYYASVSHDKRFSIAVADKNPVGVDIEAISPKLVRGAHLFMNKDEMTIAGASRLASAIAATMVWTAKEAASKSLNLHLIDTWRAVHLVKLRVKESVFTYGDRKLTATHLFERNRVVSIIEG